VALDALYISDDERAVERVSRLEVISLESFSNQVYLHAIIYRANGQ